MIRKHEVETGENDGINYELVSGLTQGDEIILSMSAVKATAETKKAAKSPFMPQRTRTEKVKKMKMKNTIIEVSNLKKDFYIGDVTVRALKGINILIQKGEFVAIMGASGSGKSTMLNILGCLDKPTFGEYKLDGVSVSELNKNELAELRNDKLGFVFQSYNLLPRTSALENVELPLFYNNKVKAKERKERAIAALEAVGLTDRMHHMPNQLSGGQQQRVAIARSLVNDPVVILADEATGNLDTRTSYEIMELFQRLNSDQGKTIVFVTHEADIARLTSRNILFRDGLVVREQMLTEKFMASEMLKLLPVEELEH